MDDIDSNGEQKLSNGLVARNEYFIGDQPTGFVVICDGRDPGKHIIRLQRWAPKLNWWMIVQNAVPLNEVFELPGSENDMPPFMGTLETMLERFGKLKLK